MQYFHYLAARRALVSGGLLVTVLVGGCASAPPPKPKPIAMSQSSSTLSEKAKLEQRQSILKVRNRTLTQLYKLKPSTKSEIEQAAGYGVFEINGLNAVLAEKHGRGMVMERSGRTTYMQLARTDIGPRATVKPYWQVLVFRDPGQLNRFVAAISPADAASEASITVYRLNEKGVSIQTDWDARYFRDPDLN